MANQDFMVFPGKLFCKKCQEQVTSFRFWLESGDTTWMCTQKHISKVELKPKKKKKSDFENE
jgi:hypothetical protein